MKFRKIWGLMVLTMLFTSCSNTGYVEQQGTIAGDIKEGVDSTLNEDLEEKEYNSEDTERDNTLTIKENQVVFNDKVLTSSPEYKEYPRISLDGRKIAFTYGMDFKNEIWGKFGIIDIKTGEIKDIFLQENSTNAFLDIQWISKNKVAITGHKNPSLQTYEIYNINSGNRLNIFYGIGFNWNKSKQYLLYTVPAPHFSREVKGLNKIVDINGQVLYESGRDEVILSGASISEAEDTVVFFERDIDRENKKLVVAKLEKGKSINILKKIKWNHIEGEIEWINKDEIKVENRHSNIVYDINSEEILHVGAEGQEANPNQQVEEEKEYKLFAEKSIDLNNDGIDESIGIFEYQGEYTTEFKLKIHVNEYEQIFHMNTSRLDCIDKVEFINLPDRKKAITLKLSQSALKHDKLTLHAYDYGLLVFDFSDNKITKIFDTNTLPYQTKNNYGIKHVGEGVIEFYDKASQVYAKYNVITSEDLKDQYYPGLNMLKDYKILDTMAIKNYYNIQIKDINSDNIDEIICSKYIPGVYHNRVFGEIDYILYFENDEYIVKKQTLRQDERLELPEIELNSYKSDI